MLQILPLIRSEELLYSIPPWNTKRPYVGLWYSEDPGHSDDTNPSRLSNSICLGEGCVPYCRVRNKFICAVAPSWKTIIGGFNCESWIFDRVGLVTFCFVPRGAVVELRTDHGELLNVMDVIGCLNAEDIQVNPPEYAT